jgi:hypothetical protein
MGKLGGSEVGGHFGTECMCEIDSWLRVESVRVKETLRMAWHGKVAKANRHWTCELLLVRGACRICLSMPGSFDINECTLQPTHDRR